MTIELRTTDSLATRALGVMSRAALASMPFATLALMFVAR